MPGVNLERRGILTPQTYGQMVLATSGVAGYWPLDDAAGTVMRDASGGGRDGVYPTGAALLFRQQGPQAGTYSVRFQDTTGQHQTRVPKTGLPDSADASFSYEIWVRIAVNPTTGYGPFINRGGGGAGKQIYLLTDPSDILWRWDAFNTGLALPDVGGGTPGLTGWHQLVYGWTPGSPGTETIWVDGGGTGKKFTKASSFAGALLDTAWFLGGVSSGEHLLNGWLARFSLYTRIPTDAEVATRWTVGR